MPGLLCAIAGSFHLLISPKKIPAYARRESFNCCDNPGKLYASAMHPAVIGTIKTLLSAWASPESCMAASLAPKSIGAPSDPPFAIKRRIPSPLPTALHLIKVFGFSL